MKAKLNRPRGNLAEAVTHELSSRIDAGIYSPGERLPSEHDLGRELGVSRTVVREAVASLRLGGRLVSRQGIGVFVSDRDFQQVSFTVKTAKNVRAALQILELRLAVEIEAVSLAAERRTPASLASIARAFDKFNSIDGSDTEEAATVDFNFHLAIAAATSNPQFPSFLEALGHDIVLDLGLKYGEQSSKQSRLAFVKKIAREHGAILSAISEGDHRAARIALRRHLETSLVRYRRLLREE
jgi:DNA-binding FadR family transcriptional regulator